MLCFCSVALLLNSAFLLLEVLQLELNGEIRVRNWQGDCNRGHRGRRTYVENETCFNAADELLSQLNCDPKHLKATEILLRRV